MKRYNKITIEKLMLQQSLMLSTSSNGDIDGAAGIGAEKGDGHQLSRQSTDMAFDIDLI